VARNRNGRRRRAGLKRRNALATFAVATVAAATIFVAASGAYAHGALSGLPDPRVRSVLSHSIVVYDRTGGMLAQRNPDGRYYLVLTLDQMGNYAPAATLAAEDKDFYHHGALDFPAMIRAIGVDVLQRRPVQGGSTITQQLIKIELQQDQKSFTRKLREAVLANEMEQRYSKAQILEMYLNRVYYGHGAYGIGAAARTYFAKDAKDLSPAQAAMLAGILQGPVADDPEAHFERAHNDELHVLHEMSVAGVITRAELAAATAEDLKKELRFDTSFRVSRAPHFVDYVISKLRAQFGGPAVDSGGFVVQTTLDPTLQSLAEKSVADGVRRMAGGGVNNGDLLAAAPATGEIYAWVGSADYNNARIGGAFDVIRSPRQPGSSFKPYVYETGLKDHLFTLASCLDDVPTDFNGYKPLDWDNSYMGTMSLRAALVESRNIPAVQAAQQEGVVRVLQLAAAMGVKSKLQPYLSTAIGAGDVTMLEHLQGYQVFADQGRQVPLISIVRVTSADGAELFNVKPGAQPGQAQVLSPAEAYLMTDVLKDYPGRWGLGWTRQMAGKSGTSGSSQQGVHQDAWMMAYNRDIVVGSWAGNTGAGGGGHAISSFGVDTGSTVLADFINGLPADWNHWYTRPDGLVDGPGGELFLPGTENQNNCQAQPAGGGGEGHGHKPGGGGGDQGGG
jgi:membrane peptidoglycan carboxypeptidase